MLPSSLIASTSVAACTSFDRDALAENKVIRGLHGEGNKSYSMYTGSNSTTVTASGLHEDGMTTAIGTITYLPPELLSQLQIGKDGNTLVDTKAAISKYDYSIDSWAFAVVLWEIITRQYPYENPRLDAKGVQRFVLDGKRLVVPREVACPDRYRELVTRCWRKRLKDLLLSYRDGLPSIFECWRPYLSSAVLSWPDASTRAILGTLAAWRFDMR